MSDYYRVRVSEYHEAIAMVKQIAATAEALKNENARLIAENARLLECIEKISINPEPRFRIEKRCHC